METCSELFKESRFKECITRLKEIQHEVFDTRDLIKENNLLCCELQDPLLSNEEYKNIQIRFKKLLEKLQGLPPLQDHMRCELRAVYNICFLSLLNTSGCHPASKMTSHISNLLLRLSQLQRLPVLPEEENEALLEQMKTLLLKDGSCAFELILVSCVWALHFIFCKEYHMALQLLETAEEASSGKQDEQMDLSHGFLVSSPLSDISLMKEIGIFNLRNTLLFLQGLAHLMLNDCASCLLTQNRVADPQPFLVLYLRESTLGASINGMVGCSTATGIWLSTIMSNILSSPQQSVSERTKDLTLDEAKSPSETSENGRIGLKREVKVELVQIATQLLLLSSALATAQQSKWDLSLQTLCDIDLSNLEAREKAMTLNLTGYCLTKKAQYHNATQHLRQALAADFTFLMPLYNLSLLYQSQGLIDAELEALNLLVTALEETSQKESSNHSLHPLKQVSSSVLNLLSPTISITHALYTLASRCKQLQRFDVAASRYLDLLGHIMKPHAAQVTDNKQVQMPSPPRLFQECAFALLSADRYLDAISVCDKVLEKCATASDGSSLLDVTETFSLTQAVEDHESSDSKRKRILSDDLSFDKCMSDEDIRVDWMCLKCKADALLKLGHHQQALDCIDRVILCVDDLKLVPDTPSKPPDKKRMRFASDAAAEYTSENITSFVADCYHSKAVVLTALNDVEEAFVYSRIASQLQPDNSVFMYDHCQMLMERGHSLDAARTWLLHRGIDTHCDLMQLEHQVLNKTATNKSVKSDGSTTRRDETYQDMDSHCLALIRNAKQPQSLRSKISRPFGNVSVAV